MSRQICLALLLGWGVQTSHAQSLVAVTEKDFLSELPIVLSVSRKASPSAHHWLQRYFRQRLPEWFYCQRWLIIWLSLSCPRRLPRI